MHGRPLRPNLPMGWHALSLRRRAWSSNKMPIATPFGRASERATHSNLERTARLARLLLGPDTQRQIGEHVRPQWPAAGPPVVWQAAIGTGYAAAGHCGGRLFHFARFGDNERLTCLNAETGDTVVDVRLSQPNTRTCSATTTARGRRQSSTESTPTRSAQKGCCNACAWPTASPCGGSTR